MTSAIAQPPTSATPTTKRSLATYLHGSGGSLIGLIGLFVILSIFAPNFFTVRNFVNVVDQVTVLGVLAIGATLVIITGGIDLSVGAILGLSTMVLGWLSHDGGWPLPLAMLAAVAVGAAAGLINGLGVTRAMLPPFIATLAMMSVARGLANIITDGQQIVGYPEWFFNLSADRFLGFFSVTIIVAVLLYALTWAYLKYRTGGRSIYAIGGSSEVARLSGIPVKRATTWVYVTAGALAGVGGIILASRLDSSQPTAGTGYELDVIAAVVIGGASLTGGSGKITGTIIGVLIIGFLRNGLNLLGVSPFLQQIVIGLVIAVAVMADVLRRRRA
ncbi:MULTISPECIES: ABC transporter permease [Microbacterium]|uniref:ABC transporter permease n=1 Tax=Microbacterium TaxID=33882 RepID=UPI002786F3BA|nr:MULTISPECIES: ABC transporter permease [Microbacterium]MDQ1082525.1 ribose transport system permease protein [Microbacterium sp. SORGH_AS_0344]MDQ1168703.1 ribose transport system permease protein [Microbacterium proteolyticum]